MRPVWTDDASRVSGSASADGRYVSLTFWGRNGDLAVRDMNTGVILNLTETRSEADVQASAETSCVSPDGKLVAYAWNSGGQKPDKGYDLRMIPVAGGTPRVVISGLPWLAPTPDGNGQILLHDHASTEQPGKFHGEPQLPDGLAAQIERQPQLLSRGVVGVWSVWRHVRSASVETGEIQPSRRTVAHRTPDSSRRSRYERNWTAQGSLPGCPPRPLPGCGLTPRLTP